MSIGGIGAGGYLQYQKIQKNSTQPVKKATDTLTTPKQQAENRDSLEISAQEKERANAEAMRQEEQAAKAQAQELKEQYASAKAQADAMAKEAKKQAQCLLIASRIMSGDEVPKEDYQYLAKNNTELYGKAIMMRANKERPEKHKRVSEDEETVRAAEESTETETTDEAVSEAAPADGTSAEGTAADTGAQ